MYLEKHQTDMEKAAMIVADTTSYKYQDQIVQDITTYANLSGLTILGFDFPTQRHPQPSRQVVSRLLLQP